MAKENNLILQYENTKLHNCLQSIVSKIRKNQGRKIGEQNTKATMIEPVLSALGWDISDWDEVHREYRAKSTDSPVDYALKIMRTPRLFLEAKGLGEDLSDRKWVAQVLGYATVAGVEWCVLTDGDEWRIYNSTAAVDADEKLFRRIKLTEDKNDEVMGTLLLLARNNIEGNQLEILWKIYFIDRQVKQALLDMFESKEKGLAELVHNKVPKLRIKEIVESLGRLGIQLDLPPVRASLGTAVTKIRRKEKPRNKTDEDKVTLKDLVVAGILQPPMKLFSHYRGKTLEAKLIPTGEIEFEGQRYNSPSTAGSAARGSITGQKMSTNGWVFWQVQNNDGTLRTLGQIRDDYVKK